MIACHPAAKSRGSAKLALRRRSTGYTSARTRLAVSPVSAGCSPGRNPPPAAACSPEFRRPERAGASPALPGVRLAAGCSRHCPSRWSIADCGSSAPTPGETPSTLLRLGPSSARRRRPQSGQGRRRPASAASGRHPRSDRGRSTRPRLAPQACPDKVRSGPQVVPIAPHRAAEPAPAQPLDAAQLEQLVAPIALYPDTLVAQVVAASTYPGQIADADRWRQMQGDASPDQIVAAADAQNWDPSVKALTAFPQVLAQMNRNQQWTTDLGNAYYNQPQDVLQAVQVMRRRAQAAGTLESTPQQAVDYDQGYIQLTPVNPQVVYVPTYNPWTVYRSEEHTSELQSLR